MGRQWEYEKKKDSRTFHVVLLSYKFRRSTISPRKQLLYIYSLVSYCSLEKLTIYKY